MRGLSAYLAPQLAAFDGPLLDAAGRAALLEAAARLPGALAFSTVGFECSLSDPKPALDLLVRFSAAHQGRTLLPALAAAADRPDHPAWQAVAAVAARWADAADPLHAGLDELWLEFDTSEGGALPALFAGPQWRRDGVEQPRAAMASLIDQFLSVAASPEVHAGAASQLARALDALPPRAQIFQVGVMRSRPTKYLRLCINELSAERIGPYLAALGYGDVAPVEALVKRVFRRVDTLALSVDVADDVGSRIGLECYLDHTAAPERPARWRALLDGLVDAGAALGDKADALLAACGVEEVGASDERWPTELRQVGGWLGGSRRGVFVRDLHHVKLVHRPAAPLAAKAYLSVRHHWV